MIHVDSWLISLQLGPFAKEDSLCNLGDCDADLIFQVLKIPWTCPDIITSSRPQLESKSVSVQVASKLGVVCRIESILEVIDLGLHDEAEEVRIEAIISMPMMVFWSSVVGREQMHKWLG